jgi:hypothetical protein
VSGISASDEETGDPLPSCGGPLVCQEFQQVMRKRVTLYQVVEVHWCVSPANDEETGDPVPSCGGPLVCQEVQQVMRKRVTLYQVVEVHWCVRKSSK